MANKKEIKIPAWCLDSSANDPDFGCESLRSGKIAEREQCKTCKWLKTENNK